MTDTSEDYGSTSVQDGANKAVWTYEDWRYYETDDLETKAWKAGFLHVYRGIDGEWTDEETMFMYELGRENGGEELARTLARGEKDPSKWDKRAGYARKS